MTKINRELAKIIRIEVDQALIAIATKHGLKCSGLGNIKFGTTLRSSFEMADPFLEESLAKVSGSNHFEIGRKIYFNGKQFELTGWDGNRPKYPISATEISTGRKYKLPAHAAN